MTKVIKRGLIVATMGLMLGCGQGTPIQTGGEALESNVPLTATQEAVPPAAQADSKTYTVQQSRWGIYSCIRRCNIYPRYSRQFQWCVRRCSYGGYGGGWGGWGGGWGWDRGRGRDRDRDRDRGRGRGRD